MRTLFGVSNNKNVLGVSNNNNNSQHLSNMYHSPAMNLLISSKPHKSVRWGLLLAVFNRWRWERERERSGVLSQFTDLLRDTLGCVRTPTEMPGGQSWGS